MLRRSRVSRLAAELVSEYGDCDFLVLSESKAEAGLLSPPGF